MSNSSSLSLARSLAFFLLYICARIFALFAICIVFAICMYLCVAWVSSYSVRNSHTSSIQNERHARFQIPCTCYVHDLTAMTTTINICVSTHTVHVKFHYIYFIFIFHFRWFHREMTERTKENSTINTNLAWWCRGIKWFSFFFFLVHLPEHTHTEQWAQTA